MVLEMLAADELAPDDPETLRATGYLVRNFKLLSREKWLQDTVEHTSQAFLGVTLGCARCHDHMYDPITQTEYYQVRAIFEPHQVRTDRAARPARRQARTAWPASTTPTRRSPTFLLRPRRRPAPGQAKPLAARRAGGAGRAASQVEPVQLPPAAYVPGPAGVRRRRDALRRAGRRSSRRGSPVATSSET